MPAITAEMLLSLLPELILALLALFLLALSLFKKENLGGAYSWVTAFGFGLTLFLTVFYSRPPAEVQLLWGEMIRFDRVGFIFRLLILAGGAMTAIFAGMEQTIAKKAEFYLLLVLSSIGFSLMVSAGNLIMLYLAIETATIPLYVLAGFKQRDEKSVESGIKYFLFGGVSSAILLYGFTLLYGFAGTTRLDGMLELIKQNGAPIAGITLASLLVLAGFAFKMSAAPFHFWAPDVYEGSPTPVAGFLSTVSKAVGFGAFIRVLVNAFGVGSSNAWMVIVAILAAASMFLGNLLAISQRDIKRLIAYSSIAQAGYMLVGVATGSEFGFSGTVYYLLVYLVTNLAVFAIISWVEKGSGSSAVSAFAGLNRRSPGMALVMMVALLSLGGIPPFGGFFAKVLVFGAAVQSHYVWLAVLGILNSVIALYYYLKIMKVMYLDKPDETSWKVTPALQWRVALALCIACIILLGVIYAPWLNGISLAVTGF